MNKATGDGLDADSCELDTLALYPVEELDLLEALAGILGAVPKRIGGPIPAGEDSVEVSNLYALETINLSKFSNLEDFNFEKLDYVPLLKCIIISQIHLDNIDSYENISDQLKSLFVLECN